MLDKDSEMERESEKEDVKDQSANESTEAKNLQDKVLAMMKLCWALVSEGFMHPIKIQSSQKNLKIQETISVFVLFQFVLSLVGMLFIGIVPIAGFGIVLFGILYSMFTSALGAFCLGLAIKFFEKEKSGSLSFQKLAEIWLLAYIPSHAYLTIISLVVGTSLPVSFSLISTAATCAFFAFLIYKSLLGRLPQKITAQKSAISIGLLLFVLMGGLAQLSIFSFNSDSAGFKIPSDQELEELNQGLEKIQKDLLEGVQKGK